MKISSEHSINRVKRTLAHTERMQLTRRVATVRIACLKWLGRWGPSGIQGVYQWDERAGRMV